jgi:hypothetical protein
LNIHTQLAMECTICYDEFPSDEKPVQFTCGHKFHRGCISKWLLLNNTCPYCRNEVYKYSDNMEIEMDEVGDLDVTFMESTIFNLYNEPLLDSLYTYLDGAIDDIDSNYLRDWEYRNGAYDIEICVKGKYGHIWTHFTYIPDSNRVFIYFNEYKLYFYDPAYLARYFKLDVENIVEPVYCSSQ